MICSHTQTECPAPNACQSHRLVICPLSAHLVPCEALTDRCDLHDLCPASSGDPVMVAQLLGEERRIVENGLADSRTLKSCAQRFPNQGSFSGLPHIPQTYEDDAEIIELFGPVNYRERSPEEQKKFEKQMYGTFEPSVDKDAIARAINDMLRANNRIGRWLSAALEDPRSCVEFKADIEAWLDEDATVRRLFGL